MSPWEYTGLVIILGFIYYNKKLRNFIKETFFKVVRIIENGDFKP